MKKNLKLAISMLLVVLLVGLVGCSGDKGAKS